MGNKNNRRKKSKKKELRMIRDRVMEILRRCRHKPKSDVAEIEENSMQNTVNMGNKKNKIYKRKRKESRVLRHRRMETIRRYRHKPESDVAEIVENSVQNTGRFRYQPKSLVVLCERAVKRYKLRQHPKDDIIQNSTVVGGKPLRKRKEVPSISQIKEKKYTIKRNKNDLKRPVCRPSKKIKLESILTVAPESVARIKEEHLDLPVDYDPLSPDREFSVVIKEEFQEPDTDVNVQSSEDILLLRPLVQNSQESCDNNPHSLTVNEMVTPLVQETASTSCFSNYPLATIVMDDIQIFANSIAEQLRTLPVNTALLLQVEIQSMIDNERELATHEC